MSTFYPAVMAQAQYACAVLGLIRKLLSAVFPSLAENRTILGTDEQFHVHIDAALMELDHRDATEIDYRLAVANAACWEMSNLCELLTDACECVKLDAVAKRYVNPTRFLHLVLKQDTAKLSALEAAVESGDRNVGRLLMRIGAILDGRAANYDTLDSAAKRKAAIDTKKVIAEVSTLIDAGKAEIIERVDAVGGKVDRLKVRGRRKCKYSETARAACLSCWKMAKEDASVRNSVNTRVTYETVFLRHARELAEHGIDTVAKFRTVLHSAQSLEYANRRKKLDEQRDGTKKKPLPPPKENGKMSGVKSSMNKVLA